MGPSEVRACGSYFQISISALTAHEAPAPRSQYLEFSGDSQGAINREAPLVRPLEHIQGRIGRFQDERSTSAGMRISRGTLNTHRQNTFEFHDRVDRRCALPAGSQEHSLGVSVAAT